MPSRLYRAALAAVLTGLTALALVAPAGARDPRQLLPNPGETVLAGYCNGFTAVITFPVYNQYIVQQTTAPDGTTTLKITGHATATVRNTTTGKSVTYNISGPGTIVIYPNGAFSIDTHGPNLLWTLPKNSFPGVPTISYTTGHVRLFVDATGLTTAYTLAGRQTNVCAVLAS